MDEYNGTCVTWAIHNFSNCWFKCDKAIASPVFCIYTTEETKWKLLLFPRGVAGVDDSIAIYLYREKNCKGTEILEVEYFLDILGTDRFGMDKKLEKDAFQKDMRKGYPRYTTREIVHQYLKQDVLTIRCNMLLVDNKELKRRQIFARTIISVETRIFQCPIENFSNLEPCQKQSFMFKTDSEEVIMQINVTSDNKGNIRFGILSYDACMKFSMVKIFIIYSQKRDVDCGEYEYWFNGGKCTMLPIKLTKRQLINKRSFYLHDNVLVLRFELRISTGFAFVGIEKDAWEYASHPSPIQVSTDWRKCTDHKNLSDCPCSLIRDLTTLQKKQGACDMELRAKTKIFPVHTVILSARSPVFSAMFSSGMKEKIVGYVDVSDLDDGIVGLFLLYLYSDQLEDLAFEDAFELCKVAEKYAVIPLREKCYTFLKDNLSLENACETLLLAYMHCNIELKELAQNIILKNGKVIFKSKEWKELAEINRNLALETTLRNWNEDQLETINFMEF